MLASRAMKYRVTIEGQAREVDVVVTPDGTAKVSVDGAARPIDVVRVPDGLSLRIDGKVYDLATGGRPDATQLAAGEARAIAEVVSDRMRARQKASAAAIGAADGEIRAPMPGRVVKVLVSKGQAVDADEPCVVVEAMKMENELRSSAAGIVAEVLVSEGANVEGGAPLIRIEPAS